MDQIKPMKKEQLTSLGGSVCMVETSPSFEQCGFSGSEKVAASSSEENRAQHALASSVQDFSDRRILVVEDNPVNQQVAVRMLEKLRCQVDVALNGWDAISKYRIAVYDLILMDCQMPDLDGFGATSQIRALETPDRRTPIIALTAYASSSEKEKCLEAGMDDLLSKPIRLPLLQNTLGRWLTTTSPTQSVLPQKEDELEEVKAVFGQDFVELAELFLVHSAQRLAALREAATVGNISDLRKIAHAFGGSCASIGASSLCKLCKELEKMAKAGAVPDCDARLTDIQTEYNRINAKLRHMMRPE